jgi:hypothetical protein
MKLKIYLNNIQILKIFYESTWLFKKNPCIMTARQILAGEMFDVSQKSASKWLDGVYNF